MKYLATNVVYTNMSGGTLEPNQPGKPLAPVLDLLAAQSRLVPRMRDIPPNGLITRCVASRTVLTV